MQLMQKWGKEGIRIWWIQMRPNLIIDYVIYFISKLKEECSLLLRHLLDKALLILLLMYFC